MHIPGAAATTMVLPFSCCRGGSGTASLQHLHTRQRSTSHRLTMLPPQRRLLVGGSAAVAAALAVVYHDDPRQLPFDVASAAGPLLRLADAETSHNAGLRAAEWGLFPRETRPDPPELAVTLWGRRFRNPLGAPNNTAVAASHASLREWQ